MHRKSMMLLITFLMLHSFVLFVYASSGEIDGVAVVTSVHDGDTFRLDRMVKGSDTVRLADVNASELGQPLSIEARDYLSELVYGKTVYLDIDDVYIYDYLGTGERLVCVAYVDHNSSHYVNVNKALMVEGLAEIKEYDNEFNATTWTLYVKKADVVPEFPSFLILPMFMIATLLAILVYGRKHVKILVIP
jgi:endonuclease YncB( thermonuclease family)